MIKRTGHTRKMDTNGRIIVPSQLRDKLELHPSDILEFCIIEINGRTFLGFECERLEDQIERAKRILRENGIGFDEDA